MAPKSSRTHELLSASLAHFLSGEDEVSLIKEDSGISASLNHYPAHVELTTV